MTIIGPIFTTIFFVGLVTFYWVRVSGDEKAYGQRWYLTWAAKAKVGFAHADLVFVERGPHSGNGAVGESDATANHHTATDDHLSVRR